MLSVVLGYWVTPVCESAVCIEHTALSRIMSDKQYCLYNVYGTDYHNAAILVYFLHLLSGLP